MATNIKLMERYAPKIDIDRKVLKPFEPTFSIILEFSDTPDLKTHLRSIDQLLKGKILPSMKKYIDSQMKPITEKVTRFCKEVGNKSLAGGDILTTLREHNEEVKRTLEVLDGRVGTVANIEIEKLFASQKLSLKWKVADQVDQEKLELTAECTKLAKTGEVTPAQKGSFARAHDGAANLEKLLGKLAEFHKQEGAGAQHIEPHIKSIITAAAKGDLVALKPEYEGFEKAFDSWEAVAKGFKQRIGDFGKTIAVVSAGVKGLEGSRFLDERKHDECEKALYDIEKQVKTMEKAQARFTECVTACDTLLKDCQEALRDRDGKLADELKRKIQKDAASVGGLLKDLQKSIERIPKVTVEAKKVAVIVKGIKAQV